MREMILSLLLLSCLLASCVAFNLIPKKASQIRIPMARDESDMAALNREPLELCDESAEAVINEVHSKGSSSYKSIDAPSYFSSSSTHICLRR